MEGDDGKRKTPPTLAHKEFQRKKGKQECPGCHEIFGKRYFADHKFKYFENGIWNCIKTNDVPQNLESSATFSDRLDEQPDSLILNIKKKLKHRLKTLDPNVEQDDESDEDEEFWTNLTLADIDSDFENKLQGHHVEEENVNNEGINPLFICLCMCLCSWQAYHTLPDVVLQNLLWFLSVFFNTLTAESVAVTAFTSLFPASVYRLYKNIGFQKDAFNKFVICRKCYKLYKYEDCIQVLEGQEQSRKCNNVLFPNHPQIARRRACGELLLKVVNLQNSRKLYPYNMFCYKSIISSLAGLLKLPSFELNCEKWRLRRSEAGVLTDVYDGNIWKEFHGPEKKHFLKDKNNYGLMLNLDWFQPYEHVQYSVGVMYAVVLNLPRAQRFKLRNVILLGIIPDMSKEPSVQSFLGPLTEELKAAWNDGFLLTSHESPEQEQLFKLAVMCVGCDIPATRKLCGFLGHGATLGCSKCLKEFPGDIGKKNYGGFDTTNWEARNLEQQRQRIQQIKSAKTATERDMLESRFGLRFSPLWDLQYFDPIRMSIIDPMHNLYQGTAKKMIKLWLELKIILPDQLKEIQDRVDSVNAASNIGAIPRKISSSFGGFTAEQWKNWTNIFSIFALVDILPSTDLEIWRQFVLASYTLTSKFITEPEIRQFERHMLQFCREFEVKYGKERVTPNMHLHAHLGDCVRDYGPIYSFWLFSFERYNGHLGSLPNNHRSIELQIMRRFTRDSFVNSIELPAQFRETFISNFTNMEKNETQQADCEISITNLIYLSKRSAPIANQDWSNISNYQYSKETRHCLTQNEFHALQKTYKAMYPNLTNASIPQSCRKCTSISISNDVFGSWESRHRRSSFIMAYWHTEDGKIVSEPGTGELTPGIVDTYYLHNIIVENESKLHLLAKVRWLFPLASRYRNYCGKPVEVWSRDLYDTFGPSAFIPVQRINCRYVRADGDISGKCVSFICPLTNRTNI